MFPVNPPSMSDSQSTKPDSQSEYPSKSYAVMVRRDDRSRRRFAVQSLRRDIDELLRMHGRKRARSECMVGKKTLFDRRKVLYRIARCLHRRGMKLRRLDNLRCDHIRVLLEDFRARHLKPATVAVYLSHLRRVCEWLKKPQLVRFIDEQVADDPELVRRSSVAEYDKSISAHGVNIQGLLERAIQLDEHFACQLALMWALGLRAQEAWMFHPRIAKTADGTYVVGWGTKGGRPRKLPPVFGEQERAVVEWAESLTRSRAEWMIPPGYTLKRWRGRFYRLTRKLGITRAHLGATAHSLRHERLNTVYEWLTGTASSVRGGQFARVDLLGDVRARQVVAELAGHSRMHVSSAYLGGIRRRT